MNWKLFLTTYSLVFFAELPDKTAFAALLMATRRNPWMVFAGSALAFLIQTGVAVILGRVFVFLPQHWVHLAAGILFLVFAVLAWRSAAEDVAAENALHQISDRTSRWSVVWSSFLVIFVAEWGDLTQLATVGLVARFQEVGTIFVAATLALWTVTAIAIGVGHHARKFIHPVLMSRISAAAFALVGGYFIFDWVKGV
ncbi:TMEM165/GDT1 family protein [Bdellovibrionota bacterium FG-1]